MPIRLVGKVSLYRGKYLFELLRNLKNFGVGRMVARNTYERYPEPCYYIVTNVMPEMDPEGRLGKAEGEAIFRGRNIGVKELDGVHLADWKLIPRELEEDYKAYIKPHIVKVKPQRIVPADVPLPPLLRKMHVDEARKVGKPVDSEPRMPITIRRDEKSVCLQEGVEVPLGTIAQMTENPTYTPLPESIAGKLWLSNRKISRT